MIRDTYCSSCGTAYPDTSRYPRICARCGLQIWSNPIPVSLVLLPIETGSGQTGILVVRRAIEPKIGLLGLVGGFLESHETWQSGGAREVFEEADVRIDPATLSPFWFVSTEPTPNRVLLFSTAPAAREEGLPPFHPSSESSERGAVFGPEGLSEIFAFPLHVRAVERFFSERGMGGPHGYRRL